jgi:ABC-type Na+ transport system ATPase subunit NatA
MFRNHLMEKEMRLTCTLLAAGLTALLAAPALAVVDQIREIDVTADLTAVGNVDAAAYWGTLETDLEAAIAARVTDLLAEDGARVLVDIREVELSSPFERAINLGDAVLVGQVNIVDDTDNANFDAYELSVSLETASIIIPAGQEIRAVVFSTDDRTSYRALIDTFAQGVVDRLK